MQFASENCIQELLSASDSNNSNNRVNGNYNENDGWKVINDFENGVEISKRRSGSFHTFRSRWRLKSVSPQQFITVANAIDAAKVICFPPCFRKCYVLNYAYVYIHDHITISQY